MPYVQSGTASIFYEIHGEGNAVVFAHGRGGNAAVWWQQVPYFSRRYKVVVFDHRCFGRSHCPPEHFDREEFDNDLIAILDAEGIERVSIVCQSMGGWTGLRTAVYHPHRVECLVLSNTPGGIDTPLAKDSLMKARERFSEIGVAKAALARDFQSRAPEAAYLYAHIGSLNIGLPDDLSRGGTAIITRQQLERFTVPTLLITSEHDEIFPPESIREVAALIPGSEIVELPTAGHSPYFEIPDMFNEIVGAFMKRCVPRKE